MHTDLIFNHMKIKSLVANSTTFFKATFPFTSAIDSVRIYCGYYGMDNSAIITIQFNTWHIMPFENPKKT